MPVGKENIDEESLEKSEHCHEEIKDEEIYDEEIEVTSLRDEECWNEETQETEESKEVDLDEKEESDEDNNDKKLEERLEENKENKFWVLKKFDFYSDKDKYTFCSNIENIIQNNSTDKIVLNEELRTMYKEFLKSIIKESEDKMKKLRSEANDLKKKADGFKVKLSNVDIGRCSEDIKYLLSDYDVQIE